ncbi:MAG: radical SAM protein [Elusimicrobia bacterium]|nr:radical SAM protein [Elusimicrobiota bacterium]
MDRRGASVGDYGAPLFLAWQLSNRCTGRCLHCCEESGPDKAWSDEMSREQSLALARQIVSNGVAYVAFGGGEPMGCPWVWEIFQILTDGKVEIKIETNGLDLDDAACDKLKAYNVACVQISIDGATAAAHERLRPGSGYAPAWSAIDRLAARGLEPELVFIPTRLNVKDAVAVYEQAAKRGVRTFVTGPMMRLGRAAHAWDSLACPDEDWIEAVVSLKAAAAALKGPRLAIYPWGIQHEMAVRAESPQSMVLVVPNGRAKLLNALPFAVADLKTESLASAWPKVGAAWKSKEVQDFVRRAQTETDLLKHANECWDLALAA